jgi:hypothetical protein
MLPVLGPCANPALLCRRMNAGVGHFRQPRSDMRVGRLDVELQASHLQAGGQRHQEASLEIAVEAFDLALSLGPVGPANPRHKPVNLGHAQRSRMPLMLSVAVRVTFDDDALGIIKQHMFGNAAEVDRRLSQHDSRVSAVSSDVKHTQLARLYPSVATKAINRSLPRRKCVKSARIWPSGRRLEPHYRVSFHLLMRRDKILELRNCALVSQFNVLPMQNDCRDPMPPGRLDPRQYLVLVRIELRRPRLARPVPSGIRITQIPFYRVL